MCLQTPFLRQNIRQQTGFRLLNIFNNCEYAEDSKFCEWIKKIYKFLNAVSSLPFSPDFYAYPDTQLDEKPAYLSVVLF